MSHELTKTDYMVSAGGKLPWHKLGTVLNDRAITAAVAVKAAKLDWAVITESVFDGEAVDLESYRLLRRSDTKEVLSIVAKGWTPLQNLQLLEIAEALAQAPGVGDFQPVIETAGSLRGGRIVWALVQTGQREFAGSAHRQYMLLSNGHYTGRGVRGTLTDVRVVCNNTLTAAENAKSAIFTTHFGNVTGRIQAAIEALGWANDATKATFAIYEALATTKVNVDKAEELFIRLFLKKGEEAEDTITDSVTEKVQEMVELFKTGRGCEGKTAFDAVNAVTDWVDHHREYRDTEGADERRFLDISFDGIGVGMKRKAVKLARELVTA